MLHYQLSLTIDQSDIWLFKECVENVDASIEPYYSKIDHLLPTKLVS